MTSTKTIAPVITRASSIVRTLENVSETLGENPQNIRWALLCFKKACSSAQTQLNSFSKCLVDHPERWELLRAVELLLRTYLAVLLPILQVCSHDPLDPEDSEFYKHWQRCHEDVVATFTLVDAIVNEHCDYFEILTFAGLLVHLHMHLEPSILLCKAGHLLQTWTDSLPPVESENGDYGTLETDYIQSLSNDNELGFL